MIDERGRFERAFEVFEMPEPAFERMFERRDRHRRAQRLSAAVLALILTVVAIGVLLRVSPADRPTGHRPSPTAIHRDLLRTIVLPRSAQPDGLEFISDSFGVSGVTRPLQGSSLEANRAVQEGFVDAAVHEFARGEAFLGSMAATYEDPAAARSALDVLRRAFRRDYGYPEPPTDPGLGEQSYLFEERQGSPTVTYLWRRGSVLMNVQAVGDLDPEVVRTIAQRMDERASEVEGG
jgi:hypothetical protein